MAGAQVTSAITIATKIFFIIISVVRLRAPTREPTGASLGEFKCVLRKAGDDGEKQVGVKIRRQQRDNDTGANNESSKLERNHF